MAGKQIYLEITDAESMLEFMTEAKRRTGLMKDISPEKMRDLIRRKKYPVRVPINLDGVLGIAENPIVRKVFGKKLEDTARKFLTAAKAGG